MDWPAGLPIPTSQLVGWLFLLGRSEYNVHGPGGLTLDQVVEIARRSAAAQGQSFMTDSWIVEHPLGPTLAVAALTGPRPFNATFCFRCVRTWRTWPLGDAVCEYPHRRSNQVKCRLGSESRHPCIPVRVFSLFSCGDRLLTFDRSQQSMTLRLLWFGV